MMYRGIVGLLLLVLLTVFAVGIPAPPLSAQEELNIGEFEDHGVRAYVFGSWGQRDRDELNAALTDAGYTTFGENAVSFGAGGHVFLGRAVLGLLLAADVNKSGTHPTEQLETQLVRYSGQIGVGVVAAAWGSARLYPMVGLGFDDIQLEIRDEAAASFDAVLDDPRGARLSGESVFGTIGVGFDVTTPVWLFIAPMMVGARASYAFGEGVEGSWREASGAEFSSGPKVAAKGALLQIMVGLSI